MRISTRCRPSSRNWDDDAGQSLDISISNPQYLVVAVGW